MGKTLHLLKLGNAIYKNWGLEELPWHLLTMFNLFEQCTRHVPWGVPFPENHLMSVAMLVPGSLWDNPLGEKPWLSTDHANLQHDSRYGWYEEKCQVFYNFAFLCQFYAFPCIHPTQDKEAMQVCIRLINKETFLTTRGIFLQERKGRRKYHLINPLICKARRWMHPEENPEWFMGVGLWEENKETHWKKKECSPKIYLLCKNLSAALFIFIFTRLVSSRRLDLKSSLCRKYSIQWKWLELRMLGLERR